MGSSVGVVSALAVYNGELYAGGTFSSQSNVVRWTGSAWVPAGGTGVNGPVQVLAVHHNRLVVGGTFAVYSIFGSPSLVDFDGATWTTFNSIMYVYNPSGTPMYLLKSINGTLYAGGNLAVPLSPTSAGILSWNGSSWVDATGGAGINMWTTYSMTANGGTLYAGGAYRAPYAKGVMQSSGGGSWTQVGGGLGNGLNDGSNAVFAVEWFHGKLYAGGEFSNSGSTNMVSMACWDGSAWAAAGGGLGGSQPYVFCTAIYNNRLIIGGQFTRADGKVIANIARLVEGAASPPVISNPVVSTNGQFGFSASGPAGSNVVVEASSNLSAWVGLRTNLMGGSPFSFSDPQSTVLPRRFYRLRVLP